MKFPHLKIGQVGYYNGKPIKKIGKNKYSVYGATFTKAELIGQKILQTISIQ